MIRDFVLIYQGFALNYLLAFVSASLPKEESVAPGLIGITFSF
jgi:hypothetical protein